MAEGTPHASGSVRRAHQCLARIQMIRICRGNSVRIVAESPQSNFYGSDINRKLSSEELTWTTNNRRPPWALNPFSH